MALIQLYKIVLMAIISSHAFFVDGCSCRFPSNQVVCTSDVLINATVDRVSYPEGSDDFTYPVQYWLTVHNVINTVGGSDIPEVVESYLPGSLCGLNLLENAIYILAGSVSPSSYTDGTLSMKMGLCNLNLYVSGGSWTSNFDVVDEYLNQMDCSNPPSYDKFLYHDYDEMEKRNLAEASLEPNDNVLRELWLGDDRKKLE